MTTSGNARTRWTRLLGVFCVAFCAAALALPAHAESAGKVLSADGDALVLRGSQILRLFRGAAVESGDQIHTGTDGKVLIVFTDSGLVWIRANSDFVVDEYSYAQGGRESAFFSLLKGGARSVTGLIGRRTRSNFRLRVPVATIGIRGTDFSVVMCQRDCRDSDGTTAAKGLYGEVIQGRIAVTPFEDRLLEREFGAGEFFHLADERSSPTPLFLPPPFLRSKQDEQARFMEQTGIAIAPESPGAAPWLSGVVGGTTNGVLTLTNGLTGTVTSLTGVTSPVLTSIESAVSTVTSPVVSLLAPTVSAVTPVVTSIAAPVVSTVAPIVTPIAAPVVSTVAPVVIPIAAPAPSVTIPGTISTILPSVLPPSPLRH
ncbi:MAG TPA: FecR domain-containing protein [Burkholderiales bacterium]|nr:FecR domain-containing protein [Burkholderiales bacterium]